MTNSQLAITTIKWLAIMFVLSISFHQFGKGLIQTFFGIQLSPTGETIIVLIIVMSSYLFGSREILAGIKRKKENKENQK